MSWNAAAASLPGGVLLRPLSHCSRPLLHRFHPAPVPLPHRSRSAPSPFFFGQMLRPTLPASPLQAPLARPSSYPNRNRALHCTAKPRILASAFILSQSQRSSAALLAESQPLPYTLGAGVSGHRRQQYPLRGCQGAGRSAQGPTPLAFSSPRCMPPSVPRTAPAGGSHAMLGPAVPPVMCLIHTPVRFLFVPCSFPVRTLCTRIRISTLFE